MLGSQSRWAQLALLAVGSAGIALWHCSVYDTSLLLAASDAGADAPTADASADADTCAHHRWPARPAGTDNGTSGPVILSAVRTLDFALPTADAGSEGLGYDLDGLCSCPGPESCIGVKNSTHCDPDGGGGRDNATGELLVNFSAIANSALDAKAINKRLKQGLYGLLFRIRGYDGTPNDPRVEVSVYLSAGPEPDADAGPIDSGIADGGEDAGDDGGSPGFVPARPKYDGTDRWSIAFDSLVGGSSQIGVDCRSTACASKFFDLEAYVANNIVVARLDFPLSLGAGSGVDALVIDLAGSVLTAKLVTENGTTRIEEGQIAGRWATSKLLTGLQALVDPFDPTKFLCGENESYTVIKEKICNAADISTDLKELSTSTPCDALSIAVGFTSAPAQFGSVHASKPKMPPACGPAYSDKCTTP